MRNEVVKQQLSTELELARIEDEYRRRACGNIYAERYSYFNESTLLHAQCLERIVLALLKRHEFTNLDEKKILDVGCGNGTQLCRFLDYNALPASLSGIDLMAPRIELAHRLHPGIEWSVGSAYQLPYQDAAFDLVMSSVVFSSILNEPLRQKVAEEIWRVRKPAGLILFHDFMYSNPQNLAVQGITYQNIRQLFRRPGAKFDFRRIILAPPISRIVAPLAYWMAYALEQLKILNTHTIAIIGLD